MLKSISLDNQGLPVVFYFDETTRDTIFILSEDVKYTWRGVTYTIPKGFVSDGASIPRWLWTLVGHPFSMRYMRQALFHDYLYKTQVLSRYEADRVLYDDTKGKCSWFRRVAIFTAVRMFGWIAWINHKKENIRKLQNG
jgi:hypothetical protein